MLNRDAFYNVYIKYANLLSKFKIIKKKMLN